MQVEESLRAEITPKNILMIGPTGVGKTEIARRLARLANAPFVKVEATKFTEVGYVGRDVESIVRDLVEMAVKMLREQAMERVAFVPRRPPKSASSTPCCPRPATAAVARARARAHGSCCARSCAKANWTSKEIELELSPAQPASRSAPPGHGGNDQPAAEHVLEPVAGPGETTQAADQGGLCAADATRRPRSSSTRKRSSRSALQAAEQNGIVFLDELDKVAKRGETAGADVSREGVQRDLLPLIEGCTVSTKYGMIKTDHILFIASGAFHLAKPSDLIPELQGRLPIRVELAALTPEDFRRILVEPDAALTRQYTALLATEGLTLEFSEDGIARLAEIAYQLNESTENIGARRLQTVMERLLEDASFRAADDGLSGTRLRVDAAYVDEQLAALSADEDLSRFIL
jgi:ATP-dependent HslUV protease ATP-binding subunit HslU